MNRDQELARLSRALESLPLAECRDVGNALRAVGERKTHSFWCARAQAVVMRLPSQQVRIAIGANEWCLTGEEVAGLQLSVHLNEGSPEAVYTRLDIAPSLSVMWLDEHPSDWFARVLERGRRFYTAHTRADWGAVFRQKDEAGLDEWQRREWKLFSSRPAITDVTDQVDAWFGRLLVAKRPAALVLCIAHGSPQLTYAPYAEHGACAAINTKPIRGDLNGELPPTIRVVYRSRV